MSNWQIIAIVVGLYSVFIAIFYLYQKKCPPFIVLLLGFAYVSHFVLTEYKIGRPSIRVYVICFVAFAALVSLFSDQHARSRIKTAIPLVSFSVVFYLWIMITSLLHGTQQESLVGWASYNLGKYVAPQLYLISAIVFLRSKCDLRFIVAICFTMAAISAMFAILQFFEVGFATSVRDILYPFGFNIKNDPDFDVESMAVSGLSQFAVPFAYVVTTFAPFALSYALFHWKKCHVRAIVAGVLYLTMGISVLLCQSRSGVVAIGISMLLTVVLLPRMYTSMNLRKSLRAFLVILAIAGMAWLFSGRISQLTFRYTDFSRMRDFSDLGRVETAKRAWKFIWQNPVTGGGPGVFEDMYGIAPHNALLNAGVYHGLPGVALLLVGYGVLLRLWFRLGRHRLVTPVSWIICGTVMGVVNYTWNGMTHNDSLVSGGYLLFMLLGVGIAAWIWENEFLYSLRTGDVQESGDLPPMSAPAALHRST